MQILWGVLIVGAGLFMAICGSLKSKFIIYRLMVARSKILWGENVHRFYQIVGVMVIIFGMLVASGWIGKNEQSTIPEDIESVRAELREKVDSGKLTKEEAIVKLAEAQAYLGSGKKDDKKYEKNVSPELEALGKELKEKLANGEMSEDEAKAAWFEAAKETKGEYATEKADYSGKETK